MSDFGKVIELFGNFSFRTTSAKKTQNEEHFAGLAS
jgi:hypothetical protein